MRRLLLLACASALAACGGGTETEPAPAEKPEETVEDSTPPASSGRTEAGMPAGFTVYPGATDFYVNPDVARRFHFKTTDNPGRVIAYYRREAEALGMDASVRSVAGLEVLEASGGNGPSLFSLSVDRGLAGRPHAVSVGYEN